MSQAHALANLFLLLALPIAGLALALVVGTAIVNPTGSAKLALGFYVIGLILFLIAKLSVLRSGRLMTFGSRLMRPGHKILYRAGYVLMVIGVLFAIGFLARGTSASLRTPDAHFGGVGRRAVE
jgi:hypothetical protein